MDEFNNFNNFAWSLFASSGQLGYYMMYKATTDEKKRKQMELEEKLR